MLVPGGSTLPLCSPRLAAVAQRSKAPAPSLPHLLSLLRHCGYSAGETQGGGLCAEEQVRLTRCASAAGEERSLRCAGAAAAATAPIAVCIHMHCAAQHKLVLTSGSLAGFPERVVAPPPPRAPRRLATHQRCAAQMECRAGLLLASLALLLAAGSAQARLQVWTPVRRDHGPLLASSVLVDPRAALHRPGRQLLHRQPPPPTPPACSGAWLATMSTTPLAPDRRL